jgi:hypothetical protein
VTFLPNPISLSLSSRLSLLIPGDGGAFGGGGASDCASDGNAIPLSFCHSLAAVGNDGSRACWWLPPFPCSWRLRCLRAAEAKPRHAGRPLSPAPLKGSSRPRRPVRVRAIPACLPGSPCTSLHGPRPAALTHAQCQALRVARVYSCATARLLLPFNSCVHCSAAPLLFFCLSFFS